MRKALPFVPKDHPELPKLLREIERLSNLLGAELGDLELALIKRQGKPRTQPQINLDEFIPPEKGDMTEEGAYWTPEAVERRREEMKASLEQSAKELHDMIEQHGGAGDGQVQSTTDESAEIKRSS